MSEPPEGYFAGVARPIPPAPPAPNWWQRGNEQRLASEAAWAARHGAQTAVIVCPHCHTAGSVQARFIQAKRGVSGGKLVAAFLTLGASIIFVGLSRKQSYRQLDCARCGMAWTVETGYN